MMGTGRIVVSTLSLGMIRRPRTGGGAGVPTGGAVGEMVADGVTVGETTGVSVGVLLGDGLGSAVGVLGAIVGVNVGRGVRVGATVGSGCTDVALERPRASRMMSTMAIKNKRAFRYFASKAGPPGRLDRHAEGQY
jgi:hypothetical protein